MNTQIQSLDLSALPEHAQNELYDFYLFLKQRYAKTQAKKKIKKNTALENLLNITAQQTMQVDANIDIRELIDQTHDVKL